MPLQASQLQSDVSTPACPPKLTTSVHHVHQTISCCLPVAAEESLSLLSSTSVELPYADPIGNSPSLFTPNSLEISEFWTDDNVAPLPPFSKSPEIPFCWGEVDGVSFSTDLNKIYDEIVHWKKNVFKVPSGKAGTAFVRELSRLFRAFADSSALEGVALKAAMTMPALLLQKPFPSSKSRDHVQRLDHRLQLWKDGNLNALLSEGRTIQGQLKGVSPRRYESLSRKFANLMMEGKVRAALRLLSESSGDVLPLDMVVNPDDNETVHDILLKKHPSRQPPKAGALVTPDLPSSEPHPVLFDGIDGQLIHKTVLKMDGAAGPSGLDAAAWKRLCSSFSSASEDLCESVAAMTRRICREFVDPTLISTLVASRLIALNKNPGVRPIGIGETVRRMMGKSVVMFLSEDIQNASGPLQVCAGHLAGCEAAVHAMHQVYHSSATEGVLLVDASNAFNSLNRETALRNIQYLCPPLAKIIINTYREDAALFVDNKTILSQEGTTQGDPLAMAMYAVAITPLINMIQNNDTTQVWYADDATAGGSLLGLRRWWDTLLDKGPSFGYFPNPKKTCLVVKEGAIDAASEIFRGTGVSLVKEGKRHLGGAIGTHTFMKKYAEDKISEWVVEMECLASIAITQPHAAYAAFTHGLKHKWTYLSRVLSDISDLMAPLEKVIAQRFLPVLTGQNQFNEVTRELLALLVRLGWTWNF